MKVRLANYGDTTKIVVFGRRQLEQSVYNHVPFNAAAARRSVREIIKSGNGDILLAVNDVDEIRGILIAWHEPLIWTNRKVATDIHFLAEQGGDMLLRAFRNWAKEKGCSEVCMGTFNDRDEDRIERLFNRIGFRTVGKAYRMELKDEHH